MYEKLAVGALFLLMVASCPLTDGGGNLGNLSNKSLNLSDNSGGDGGLNLDIGSGTTAESMLKLCPQVKTKRWNDFCNAVFSKDPSKCLSQRQYGTKEACEIMIVAVKKNPSLCESVNKYVTGVDSSGKVVNTTFATDCYGHYAVARLDKSYCSKAGSKAWCELYVDIDKNEVPLERCGDHYKCVMSYAWNNNDKKACEKLKRGYGEEAEMLECLALVTGDEKHCNGISDIDYKYLCIGYSKLRKAIPSEGVFIPEKCDKNMDCEREVIERMEKWVARH
ncbi:MAG: hypothetical protein QW035_00315 [Candidatus Anstonellales archaeon]